MTGSPSMHCAGGGDTWGSIRSRGVPGPGGVLCSGGGGCLVRGDGLYPRMHWGRPPPHEQNSWHATETRMHSSRMHTVCSSGHILGRVYLVLGGVPGPGGCTCPGGVPGLGGVPGPGGCTWSRGVYLPGGCTCPGGCTWSGGCTCPEGTWSGTPPSPVDRHTPVKT